MEDSRPSAQTPTTEETGEPFHAPPNFQGPPSRRSQTAGRDGCLPGDVVPDEAVLEKVRVFVDHWYGGNPQIHANVRLHKRQVPSAWFFVALKRLVAEGKHERATWGFVRRILDDFFAAGGVTTGAEATYDDEMNRILPSQRKTFTAASGARPERAPASNILAITPEQQRHVKAVYAAAEAEAEPPPSEGEGPLYEIARRLLRQGKLAGVAHVN